jgi:hypothetical protein
VAHPAGLAVTGDWVGGAGWLPERMPPRR